MKQSMIQQFNLPAYIKGKSFGEAAGLIQKKFKERNDPASKRTMDEMLGSLKKAQEFTKMQQALKTESQQIPDQMNGQVPEGMGEFASGGQLGVNPINKNEQEGTVPIIGEGEGGGFGDLSGAAKGSAIVGAAGTALDLGMTAFGDPNVDISGRQHIAPQSSGMGAASGALKGASAGAAFGPLGAGIGAAVGLGAGLIGANKQNKAANIANNNFTQATSAGFRQSDFAYGGHINKNKYQLGGGPDDPIMDKSYFMNLENIRRKGIPSNRAPVSISSSPDTSLATRSISASPRPSVSLPDYSQITSLDGLTTNAPTDEVLPSNIKPTTVASDIKEWSGFRKGLYHTGQLAGKIGNTALKGVGKGLDWTVANAANIGQFAPVASNLLELSKLKKSPTQRGSRLDSTYKPYIPDEARQLNQLEQQNTERALTESSGGDLGALRSNLLGAGINKLKAQSDVMANNDRIQAGESAKKQQFDRQKDITNIQLDNDFLDRSAKDKAAFENTKSDLKRALFEDVGKISKEHMDKKTVEQMFGYKWNGKYYTDQAGKRFSSEDVFKNIKELFSGKKKEDKTE